MMTGMGWLRKIATRRQPQRPLRHWLRDDDGTFYRNCPLIKAEQDAVMALPCGRRRTWLLDKLTTEWFETFAVGVQRKAELEPGDVETVRRDVPRGLPAQPRPVGAGHREVN